MDTLNTTLQVIANPAYAQNPQAQKIVGKILALTGVMSPVEVANMSATQPQLQPVAPQPTEQLQTNNQ